MRTVAIQALHKAIYLTGGINNTLFASEEGMASRANIGADHWLGGAGRPGVAAGTNDLGVRIILRMKTFFHHKNLSLESETQTNSVFLSGVFNLDGFGVNADPLFIAADVLKLYKAVSRSKKGIIAAKPDIKSEAKRS